MYSSFNPNFKSRRRKVRSCDTCRLRKVRCDASTMPDNQCSHCLAFGELCTYAQPPVKRGPKSKSVEELKKKIAFLENKLRTVSVCALCSQPLQSTFDTEEASSPEDASETDVTIHAKDSPEGEDEVSEHLTELFGRWQISTLSKFIPRLFGLASNFSLVQNAFVLKEKYLGHRLDANPRLRRPIYWAQFPWEKEYYANQSPYVFPPRDLIEPLLDLYFANVHPTFPILHSDSFRKNIAEGLYLTDTSSGAVLLVVLALASRYSNDPRVMIDGNTLSSGWKFVAQLRIFPDLCEPTVYHAQFYCLMALYALGNSTPHVIWVYLGVAIRFVRFHGRFLRKRQGPTFQDELWNRAFWSVYILDGLFSCILGRSPAIRLEDFDVDPPLEIDDEYWDHGFVQPPGKPSALSFFVHFVRLFEILGKTLAQLYASRLLKSRTGMTVQREKETVAELDSLMNAFLGSLPPHLRWDPTSNPQGMFFDQSATLYVNYYWLQITIHRLYLHNQSPLAGPSLSICLTAARSALSVAEIWTNKTACVASSLLQNTTYISAIILLINVFVNKRARESVDVDRDLASVQMALKVFKACETRWQSAGRLWELIQELQTLEPQPHQDDPLLIPPSPFADVSGGRFGAGEEDNFTPGTSIEQLLSETDNSMYGWDTELMSMWLAAPGDLMNVDQWGAYIDTTGL